jgi:predicted ATP-grasp superfamily ATP-dependent carboligase
MGKPEQHGAVILTLSPTGLAVARSLAPRGVRVWGVDRLRTEVGHFSRWVERDSRVSYLPEGQQLLDGLMALGSEQDHPPVLYTAGDTYIDFVADHHLELRQHFILAESMQPQASSLLMDKQTFYARCQELGVDMPRTFFPSDEPDVSRAARELRYPAIVKPTQGHLFRRQMGGAKLVEVAGPEEAMRWWCQFRDWGGESVLQEVVPGPETNIFVGGLYRDTGGTVRSLFTARKSRQYPPMYGSGSYMEACWAPEISDLSIDLVSKLQYTGICGTEYKWEPRDESWKLIEMNPRPTLWYALPPAAGVDVVWDAHCDLTGNPNPVHIGCQSNRMRWQLPSRDLPAALHFLRKGELGWVEFFRTVVDPRRKEFGVSKLNDWGTILGAGVDLVSKYFSHIRKA